MNYVGISVLLSAICAVAAAEEGSRGGAKPPVRVDIADVVKAVENTLAVTELRCEGRENPSGIVAAQPRLSWILQSGQRDVMQSAYQVLVASSPELLERDEGDLWDSGMVSSDRSIQLVYGGRPLATQSRYFWKVRVWDNQGRTSGWSLSASWQMAIPDADGWQAEWIAMPESVWPPPEPTSPGEVAAGKWIWCTEGARIFVRKTFDLADVDQVANAAIRIEADNQFDLWVNGQQVCIPAQTDWRKTPAQDIRNLLKPGENIVCIRALNTDTPAWFMSALRAGLQIDYAAGPDGQPTRTQTFLSDRTWMVTRVTWPKVHMQKAFTEEEWRKPGFKDVEPPDICQDIHPRLTRRSWYGRKEFVLPSKPVSAQVYVTARGCYELHLNGQKVGNDLLTPDPSKRVQLYQIYDVTDSLVEGRNCLSALVGGGWASTSSHTMLRSQNPLLLAQLQLTYADGRSEIIATDGDIYKYVEIRVKGDADDRIDLFWNTAARGSLTPKIDVEAAADGDWHTYLLDFSDEADWTGNLTALRIDPNNSISANFELDYVRFMETIPEPATLGMIAIMGGGMLFVRRLMM